MREMISTVENQLEVALLAAEASNLSGAVTLLSWGLPVDLNPVVLGCYEHLV